MMDSQQRPAKYYGSPVAYRQDPVPAPHLLLPRSSSHAHPTAKKSFASRLANQLDKLTGGGTLREKEKTGTSRAILHHDLFSGPPGLAAGNPAAHHSQAQRRAFRNVFYNGHAAAGSSRRLKYYHRDTPHFVHPPHYADLGQPPEFEPSYALNANLCLCDDSNGTYQSRSRCRSCGLERVRTQMVAPVNAPYGYYLRRTQSEESITMSNSNQLQSSYELMPGRKAPEVSSPSNALYYDDTEHDLDYAEADYIYSSGGRKVPPPRAVLKKVQLQQHQGKLTRSEFKVPKVAQRSKSSVSGSSHSHSGSSGGVASPCRQQQVNPRHIIKANVSHTRSSRSASRENQTSNNTQLEVIAQNNNSSVIYLNTNSSPERSKATMVTISGANDDRTHATTIEVRNTGSRNNNMTSEGSEEPFTEEEDSSSGHSSSEETSAKEHDEDSDSSRHEDEEEAANVQHKTSSQPDSQAIESSLLALDRVVDGASDGEDYDADCSQLESPRKVQTAVASLLEASPRRRVSLAVPPSASGSSRLFRVLQQEKDLPEKPAPRPPIAKDVIQEFGGEEEFVDSSRDYARRQRSPDHQHPAQAPPPPSSTSPSKHLHHQLFHDTTRLRQISRPSVRDSGIFTPLSEHSNVAYTSTRPQGPNYQLGRRGISQSFKERPLMAPVRPREPPPPPPSQQSAFIYDVADAHEESNAGLKPAHQAGQQPQPVKLLHTASSTGSLLASNGTAGGSLRRAFGRATGSSSSFKERSRSFTPKTIINKGLAQLPKSFSYHSLDRGAKRKTKLQQQQPQPVLAKPKSADKILSEESLHQGPAVVTGGAQHNSTSRRLKRFRDLRKILSSPSLGGSQAGQMPTEHIYEEIPDEFIRRQLEQAEEDKSQRPLPPLPQQQSPVKKISTASSQASSTSSRYRRQEPPGSPVKSIFEGATKYDILHYLEDAKERGLTDIDTDIEGDNDTNDEEEKTASKCINREDDVDEIEADLLRSSSTSSSRTASSSSSSSSSASSVKRRLFPNTVDIERNDSGLGSEKKPVKAKMEDRIRRRRRTNLETVCEDCDQSIEEVNKARQDDMDTDIPYDPKGSVCLPCGRRRAERKEILSEIVETEVKYGRDLRIIQEEFQRPMEVAGLLTQEQLAAIFLNVEELAEMNRVFTESLKDAIDLAIDEGDDDLCTVCIGQLFLKAEPMLGAFKSYCTRQGTASQFLAAMEREKELLRVFLRVSQMENAILRRMNLSSFLMVPVQRVTKYPLLLSRLLKVTPSPLHPDRPALQAARQRVEHYLEHMNQEQALRESNLGIPGGAAGAAGGSNKLWRRISLMHSNSLTGSSGAAYQRGSKEQLQGLNLPPGLILGDVGGLLGGNAWGVRKLALDSLNWSKEPRDQVHFALESRLLFTSSTTASEPSWKMKNSAKLTPVNAILVTLGGEGRNGYPPSSEPLLLEKDSSLRHAALLLVREKGGRFSLVREPLFLERCVICWDPEWDDCFEVQEFSAKETFLFKAEDPLRTRQWFRCLQFHALSLGQWRRRRNAMANIMMNGMRVGNKD